MLLGLYIWETNLIENLTKMNANRRNCFAVSCSATVTDEFELQLTKTGDKARNLMTMFQNWSNKDEIETSIRSIRTLQSVRDEIENTFSKIFIEWRDDENGRENLYFMYQIRFMFQHLRLPLHNTLYHHGQNNIIYLNATTRASMCI